MLTRVDASLDRAVVLFEHVVQIWRRPMPAVLLQSALGFELYDGRRVSGMLVGVDDPRVRMVLSAQRFGQGSALLWPASCLAESRKSRVAPVESTAR